MNKHINMIQELVDTIEKDLSYEINIIELAKVFDISPWHFQRLFKSIVGDTLGSYIRGRKVSIAANKLLHTQDTIINIAFEVGFSSHEAFTRAFKSHFSYTPKEFRTQKPKVLINKKPLLSDTLLEHISTGIIKEPKIMDREETILIGIKTDIPSPFISTQHTCEFVYESWMKLFEVEGSLPNRSEEEYYGLSISKSGNFTEDTLGYLAAVRVPKAENIDEMRTYILPKQKIAVFSITTDLESDLVKQTIDYIYGYWLPNSSYIRGVGDDYELFTQVKDFMVPDFNSYYVIPILDKG